MSTTNFSASGKRRDRCWVLLCRLMLIAGVGVWLSGCYSNGRWTMPNFAFWKTSDAAKEKEGVKSEAVVDRNGVPPKPSTLAGQGELPPPGAGLTTTIGSSSTGGQYPYPSTSSPPMASRTNPAASNSAATGASPAGIQPQQGPYSPVPPPASGYAAAPANVQAPPTSYPQSHGGTAGATAHLASTSSGSPGWNNPVRPAPPTVGGLPASSATRTDRPNATAAANEYRPPMPPDLGDYQPASYAPPQPYPPAAPVNSPNYLPPAPVAPTGPMPSGVPSGLPGTMNTSPGVSPTGYSPAANAARPMGGGSATPVSYSPPGLPGQSGNGYVPAANDYRPGDNGYQPPGAAPYTMPAAPYTAPSGRPYGSPSSMSPPSDNGYRPGGTSDYIPRRAPNSEPPPAPSYQAVDANVRPAGYLR